MLTLDEINDPLTALAVQAGIDTRAEGVDESVDDLTHVVARTFGVST